MRICGTMFYNLPAMRTFVSLSMTLLTFATAVCQSNMKQNELIDEIYVNGVGLGEDLEKFIEKLGNPDSINSIYSEIDGLNLKRLYYGGSTFFFHPEYGFYSFTIDQPGFVLGPYGIRVGDPDYTLQKHFPNAYKQFKESSSGVLRVYVLDDSLNFVMRYGKISEVYIHNPS